MAFNLKKILRALLFSTSQPLSIKDVQAVITRYHARLESAKKAQKSKPEDVAEEDADLSGNPQAELEELIAQVPTLLTATQIREAMEEISADLESTSEVYRLMQGSAGFKFALSPDFAEWVRLLRDDPRPQKLTQAALETLAIIAYRQPVTRAEIEAIRGVNADSALSKLSERELVCITGRADLPGRPLQYGTTEQFLDFVGVTSLEELPASDVLSPGQISEWIKNASSPNPTDREVGLPEEDQAPAQMQEGATQEEIPAQEQQEEFEEPAETPRQEQ